MQLVLKITLFLFLPLFLTSTSPSYRSPAHLLTCSPAPPLTLLPFNCSPGQQVITPPDWNNLLYWESAHYGLWYEKTFQGKQHLRISKETVDHRASLKIWLPAMAPFLNQAMELLKLVHPTIHARWTTAWNNIPTPMINFLRVSYMLPHCKSSGLMLFHRTWIPWSRNSYSVELQPCYHLSQRPP